MLFAPSFVSAFDKALSAKYGHKRLVIIQLVGGNDGLNTFVPYRNDLYYKSRPSLALQKNEILKLNDDYGTERDHALKDIFVEPVSLDKFYGWMEKRGKIGGQAKFPRVLNKTLLEEWESYIGG